LFIIYIIFDMTTRARRTNGKEPDEEEEEYNEMEEVGPSRKRRASSSSMTSEPRKRRSIVAEDDEDEFIVNGSEGNDDDDDDVELIDVEEGEEGKEGRDGGPSIEDLMEDLAEEEESGTQPSQALTGDEDKFQVGVIEKMTLVNFMCHRHLTVSFGPNVNFIVGRNGSWYSSPSPTSCSSSFVSSFLNPHQHSSFSQGGKSAILVALTIALGGKTGFSGRGQKLSDLIFKKAKYVSFLFSFVSIRSSSHQQIHPFFIFRSLYPLPLSLSLAPLASSFS
jgi:hypothetical protein